MSKFLERFIEKFMCLHKYESHKLIENAKSSRIEDIVMNSESSQSFHEVIICSKCGKIKHLYYGWQ